MKRRDEVTVGVLITVAVVVLLLGTLWLARGGLKSGYPLYTRFAWGQNLKQGQPVLLAGVSVGYVGDVNLRRDGFLDVMLSIDNQYTVPKGSKASVKAVGIFGDVAVALTPPFPVPVASYASGDTVPPGPPSADVTEIMNRVDSIGKNVSALTSALQREVVEAGTLKDLHKTVLSATALSTELQVDIARQSQNFTAALATWRDLGAHLEGVVDSTKIAATLDNVRATSDNVRIASDNATRLVANLDSTNKQLKSLLAVAEHGNGTVGKLLTDSLLYSDTRHLLQTLDSLVADVKAHPKKYINVRIF